MQRRRYMGALLVWGALLGGAVAQPASGLAGASVPWVVVGPQAPAAPQGEHLQWLRNRAAHAVQRSVAADGYRIDTASREAVRLFYTTVFASSIGVPSAWNGSVAGCVAGSTSTEYQQATLRRINWIRAMAGVPARVVFDPVFSSKAQQAALMMAASRQLSHYPDAGWPCYSAGGAEGAGSSNIGLGHAGIDAITYGYLRDSGANNAPVGHRRWLLYPQTQTMGVGDVAPEGQDGAMAANALWVFDGNFGGARPAVRDDFVAWPPPGFVPSAVVFPRWSLSYPGADFSNATVRMTENGSSMTVRTEPVSTGAGEPTLVWLPGSYTDGMSWATPTQDTVYEVAVDNVVVQGQPRSFSYQVTVFDPSVRTSAAPVLQGPTTLAVGQLGQYGMVAPAIGGADVASQWRAVALESFALRDGAEAGAGAFVTDVSSGYAVVTTDAAASGAYAFHLAHASPVSQVLMLGDVVVPAASTWLNFSSRLGLATQDQVALLEVSADGGATWQVLYRQAGKGSSDWGEAGFSRRSVSLQAYADQAVRLRWRYGVEGGGSYYPQSSTGIGWYIDDIELTGADRLGSATAALPVEGGSFAFAPTAPGRMLLQVRHGMYGFFEGWSAALRVGVTGAAVDTAAQVECLLGWAERQLPELLAPAAASRTDLAGWRYRYYAGSNSYLGINQADSRVFFLPAGSPVLQDLGPLAGWLETAGCAVFYTQ